MSPMSRSDARKREIQDRINTMNEHLELAQMGAWPHPPRRSVRPMSPMTNSSARKRHENTTPKENPMTKHPETTTEWLEDIALELHAITGLLNERLAVVHPGGQSNELNNDDPDEALAQVLWDHVANSDFEMHYITRTTSRALARIARQHILGGPDDEPMGVYRRRDVEALRERAEKAEAECDEWKAKFEQADNLLSRTRDECDEWASRTERWTSRYAALRAGIEALTCTGYDHTPDCVKEQKGARAVGETFWHPDCGRCWEDSLHDLLNPTEGETGADA